ncbi:MAG TPA: hypothetical protein VGO93_01980, partial [Candidatus Xenobia bacterium]
ISKGLTWNRSEATQVHDVTTGWLLEAKAPTRLAASAMARGLGPRYPAMAVTRADGTPCIRLIQVFPTQSDAIVKQKELQKRLSKPVDVVRRTHRQTTTVLILETTIKGKDNAQALRQQLEEHAVTVSVKER